MAGLTLALLLGPGPLSSAAGPSAVRVLQLNLCGSGFARCWTGQATARAAAAVRENAPDVVTLNEICAGDLATVRHALAAAHGGGTVAAAFAPVLDRRTAAPVRCRDGEAYGIGVALWSADPAARFVRRSGRFAVQDAGQPEQRGWICLAGRLTACSTHLASGRPAVTARQCGELVDTVLPAAGGAPSRDGRTVQVLGGDLNLTQVCPHPGYRQGGVGVQHVLAGGAGIDGTASVDLHGSTDHPGLLVTLDRD